MYKNLKGFFSGQILLCLFFLLSLLACSGGAGGVGADNNDEQIHQQTGGQNEENENNENAETEEKAEEEEVGGAGESAAELEAETIDWNALEKGVLVDFAGSAAASTTPYKDWNQILRHAQFTQYVADANPEKAGITETNNAPADAAFAGIRGQTPINFQKGHKIVATFYNRTQGAIELRARISFDDLDSPLPQNDNLSWHTMYFEDPTRELDRSVPPLGFRQAVFNITDASNIPTGLEKPVAGLHNSVNLNFCARESCGGGLVLTKLELTNQADVTKPLKVQNLEAHMVTQSEEAGASAVELSWDRPVDMPGVNGAATGVNRCMIYRNGELHAVVTADYMQAQGNRISYIDLMVEPEVTYEYAVTALDSAVDHRFRYVQQLDQMGNESEPATLEFTTSAFTSHTLINPYQDFNFLGAVRLPVHDGWGYASEGLALDPNGNPNPQPGELPGALIVVGHPGTMGMAAVSVPTPRRSFNSNELLRGRMLSEYKTPWPNVYMDNNGQATWRAPGGGDTDTSLTYHPAVNGVPARLYYTISNNYSPSSGKVHGSFSLDLDPANSQGAWFLRTEGTQNDIQAALHDGFCFAADPVWAAENVNGKSLICGQSFRSGTGIQTHGPALYASAPWASGALPLDAARVDAVQLLRYGGNDDLDVSHWVTDWIATKVCSGAVWLKSGDKSAVMFACGRPVGDTWYGGENGVATWGDFFDLPRIFESPGWRSGETETTFYFYNPEDLARVVRGEMQSWEPQPYLAMDFKDLLLGGGDMYHERLGAITFDPENGYLYLIEKNSDTSIDSNANRRSLIYVWQLLD